MRPVILVVDDLQWADPASIALWGLLARSARQLPLLLVGLMRPVPQREELLSLRRVASGGRVQLDGLAATAVADLVAALTGGQPDEDLLRLADGAAGNPLYVTELIDALMRASGVAATGTGMVRLTTGSAPGSLTAAIADRLDFVSGPVRAMLRAAALLGTEFVVPDLADGAGPGRGGPGARWLDEACARSGCWRSPGPALRFRHPLIRAALYDDIPAPVRAAWHGDAGRALAEAGAPPAPGRPASCCGRPGSPAAGSAPEASQPVDEWVLGWLTRTADSLVGQAPAVAAELLARAVASSPPGLPARPACRPARGRSLPRR